MMETNETIEAPAGMREVSRDEFFTALRKDSRDIMPNTHDPLWTTWTTTNQTTFGRTYPGWKNPGGRAAYFLVGGA